MLKKISTRQLRLGMHIHALDGAWLDHPFWKPRFVLANQADLDRLLASDVRACWIDLGKGVDVAPEAATPAAAPTVADIADLEPPAAPSPVPLVSTQPGSMAQEVRRAAVLVAKSKQAVILLFNEARLGRAVDAQQCLPLVDEIAGSVARNPGAMVSLARLTTTPTCTRWPCAR